MKTTPSIPSPQARQRGSMVFTVLIVAFLLLLIGSTTILALRNSSKLSGMQRREYQDLHAADAGLARMQYRLNQAATLCNGWFGKADSDAVIAAMVPTVDSLPSVYGATRAARMHSFQVAPGRPMRIKFSSTGGRKASGGGFDSSSTHILKGTLRMRTLADFAAFSETELRIGKGSTWKGRVHSPEIHIGEDVTFLQEVTYVNTLDFEDPSGTFNDPSGVVFKKGKRQVNANPFTLDRIFISTSEAGRPACGGSPAKTYEELAKGLVTGEKKGFSYTGSTSPIYIPLDSIKVAGGFVKWRIYAYKSSVRPPRGSVIHKKDSVAINNFNGVIYVRGKAYVGGTLSKFSITLASSDDIFAAHNIQCVGNDTLNSDLRVALGFIAASDFRIWDRSPTSITVEAAVIAREGWYAADGTDATHLLTNLSGGVCIVNDTCWNLKLLGGFITKNGGSSGPWYAHGLSGHSSRAYEYDDDNLYSPPPKFPALWGTGGASVPLWEAVSWGEN